MPSRTYTLPDIENSKLQRSINRKKAVMRRLMELPSVVKPKSKKSQTKQQKNKPLPKDVLRAIGHYVDGLFVEFRR
jgi:hypothetical protein